MTIITAQFGRPVPMPRSDARPVPYLMHDEDALRKAMMATVKPLPGPPQITMVSKDLIRRVLNAITRGAETTQTICKATRSNPASVTTVAKKLAAEGKIRIDRIGGHNRYVLPDAPKYRRPAVRTPLEVRIMAAMQEGNATKHEIAAVAKRSTKKVFDFCGELFHRGMVTRKKVGHAYHYALVTKASKPGADVVQAAAPIPFREK